MNPRCRNRVSASGRWASRLGVGLLDQIRSGGGGGHAGANSPAIPNSTFLGTRAFSSDSSARIKPRYVWSIRIRSELGGSQRDLALFDMAVDSRLRACDLVRPKIDDVCSGSRVRERATAVQRKTGNPVRFEITEQTRKAVERLRPVLRTRGAAYSFPGRDRSGLHPSTRQYARIVRGWVESIGLDSEDV